MRKSWTEGPHGWLDKPSHCRQISNEFMSICRSQRQKGVKHKLLPLLYFDGWLSCMREHFAIDLYSLMFDLHIRHRRGGGCCRWLSPECFSHILMSTVGKQQQHQQQCSHSLSLSVKNFSLFFSALLCLSLALCVRVDICILPFVYLPLFFLALYLLIISINKDLS